MVEEDDARGGTTRNEPVKKLEEVRSFEQVEEEEELWILIGAKLRVPVKEQPTFDCRDINGNSSEKEKRVGRENK